MYPLTSIQWLDQSDPSCELSEYVYLFIIYFAWDAEPIFELAPTIHAAGQLLTELRCTLSELRCTLWKCYSGISHVGTGVAASLQDLVGACKDHLIHRWQFKRFYFWKDTSSRICASVWLVEAKCFLWGGQAIVHKLWYNISTWSPRVSKYISAGPNPTPHHRHHSQHFKQYCHWIN